MLAHDTNLRQGDLLTDETAVYFGLIDAQDRRRHAIVISHDCDLQHKAEPQVEVIVAERLAKEAKPDSSCLYAKNPRRLHLTYQGSGVEPLVLEVRHSDRRSIAREDFVKHAANDTNFTLHASEKQVLKQWLAARYGRPAFPDEFEIRMRKRCGGKTVEQCIAKVLAPSSKYLIGVFFDLGAQRNIDVVEGEPYVLLVSIVYDANEGGPEARAAAESIADQLRNLFKKVYGGADTATEIALEACEAVADTHITLADIRRVSQWRLEHLSLRGEDQGDLLPIGEMPV